MKQESVKEVIIQEKSDVQIDGVKVTVTGPLGKIEREFKYDFIKMEKKDGKILLSIKKSTKREKKILGSVTAHIKNMIEGVINGFEYKLQVCSVHFPITTTMDNAKKQIVVKNFLGESRERRANILESATVKISGDIITVTSPDIEKASQTAANIEMATRIKSRDRRVFQDGIFITSKAGEKI